MTNGDQFIILIIGAVDKGDDALGRAGFTGARISDFCGDMDCITVKNRMGEFSVAHAEIADRGAERRITNRNSDHQAEGEDGVDQRLAEFCIFGKFVINM